MLWKDFVKKWQLQQKKKPESAILTPRAQFVFACEPHVSLAVDLESREWTESWCLKSKEAVNAAIEEFLLDYNSLEDKKH